MWEHGLGRVHGLSKYILEGVRELEDVCPGVLGDFPVTFWGDGPVENSSESLRERAVALASLMAV